MKIVPALVWKLDGDPGGVLDPRLLPLLRAVAGSGSLAAAVAQCGISYRAAWGVLRDYQRLLGEPLVLLERGRGARLAPCGERLLAAEKAAARRLARILPDLAAELVPLPPTEPRATVQRLRVAASHDLVLAALVGELMPAELEFELAFMGSLPALDAFAEGRVDVAGFHVPIADRNDWDCAPFLRGLRTRRDRLVRFADREQGLMLPQGNPAHVKSLRDIARQRLRFVNRQRGSGTRLLIDQVLAREGVDRAAIAGYGNEEFTHRAVAATVASGGAAAGFGLRAAAAEYGLAFVSVVRERYFLALRARDVDAAGIALLTHYLRSPAFERIARGFAGYRTDGAGTIVGLDAIGAA